MKAYNVSMQDMEKALRRINKKYDNNIIFNRFDWTRTIINFTLKTKSSKEKGARVSYQGNRLISACWHVHGDFFDTLFEIKDKTIIKSSFRKEIITIDKDGGNWEDWNIGSDWFPLYFSEACFCDCETEEDKKDYMKRLKERFNIN